MPETLYDLFFSGQLLPGAEPEAVRQRIGKMFSADGQMLERLFSGRPVRIKSAVDQELAARYRLAFRNAGALVEIRPSQSPPATPPPARQEDWSLLPPRTGSLIDCAPNPEPAPLPKIDHITLAPGGSPIDTRPPPPPLQLDTSAFSLAPANSGSLEGCHVAPPAAQIPDIGDLRLEE